MEPLMIDLYTDASPNGFKITIALEELALRYQLHHVRIERGENRQPEFLAINPYGRIPAIIDRAKKFGYDGVEIDAKRPQAFPLDVSRKDREATEAAFTDEMIDAIALIGDESHCRDRIARFVANGVTTVCIHPFIPDPEAAWNTIAALAPR